MSSSFSYTGEFTSRFVPSYRDYNIMNSQDQMEVYNEMERKGWLNFARVYNYSSSGIYGKMYHLTHDYNPTTGVFGLENTPEARANYLRDAEMRNTNWFSELFSPSLIQNHSLSFSGGTKNLQTYVSVSAMLDPGWMRASNVRRYTGNLNATYTFSPKLSVSALINLSSRMQRAPGTVTQDANAATGEVSRGFDINPFSYALNTSRTLDPNEFYTRDYAPFNIKHELDNNYIDLGVKDIKLQLELKWKPIKGLTLALLGAYKDSGTTMESIVTEYANRALAFRAMQDVYRAQWQPVPLEGIRTSPTHSLRRSFLLGASTIRRHVAWRAMTSVPPLPTIRPSRMTISSIPTSAPRSTHRTASRAGWTAGVCSMTVV